MATQHAISVSAIEEGILLWEGASVPWNSQLDVAAPRLDPERVRTAYNAALAHHELTSCGLQADERGRFAWVPSPTPVDIGEVEVVECPTEADVDRLRAGLLDEPIPVDQPPLVRVVIARRSGDDMLLTSASHILCDGLGLLRLLRSVSRAYLGIDDPPPAVDIATAHRVLAPTFPTSLPSLTQRWLTTMDMAASAIVPRVRVAPRGGSESGGFGVVTRTVPREVLSAAKAPHANTSFDDFAVAAIHLAIHRWNGGDEGEGGRIGVSLGVNLRSFDWFDDVVANLATIVSVTTDPPHRRDLGSILEVVRPQLVPEVRFERARLIADGAAVARSLPFSARKQALAMVAPGWFDSFAVSNGGVITDPPRFALDHEPECWVSQPAVPAVGLAMALFTLGGTLRMTLRYRRERFDEDGAGAFADTFVEALTGP